MGQTEVVACLLEAGASPNCADRKGLNSLHLAVVSNYTECLRALLMLARHPVDLDAMNYEGIRHYQKTSNTNPGLGRGMWF